MKLKINIKNKAYEVDVLEEAGKLSVRVGEKEFVFGLSGKHEEAAVQAPSAGGSRSKQIKSSLAGIVSEVFVKEGDPVKKHQKVLTLSAMKMENEIVSESDGKIKKVAVKAGDKVKEGDVLITLA